ncbi:MAG: hypothetical protein ACPHL6_09640, partial [Rubripirellula sp.]
RLEMIEIEFGINYLSLAQRILADVLLCEFVILTDLQSNSNKPQSKSMPTLLPRLCSKRFVSQADQLAIKERAASKRKRQCQRIGVAT